MVLLGNSLCSTDQATVFATMGFSGDQYLRSTAESEGVYQLYQDMAVAIAKGFSAKRKGNPKITLKRLEFHHLNGQLFFSS